MRGRLLGTFALALALLTTACDDGDSRAAGSEPGATASATAPPVMTQDQARGVLAGLASPADGRFDGGTFQVGEPIPGPDAVVDGRLASVSYDFFYLLDDGDRGSWGAGVKIYGTPDEATRAADRLALFWSCDGPRTVIGDLDDSAYDELMATWCRRAGGDDYLATVSAVSGVVTANLTVAAPTSARAVTELEAAWGSLDETAREAGARVGSGH